MFANYAALHDSVGRRLNRMPLGFSEWLRETEHRLERGGQLNRTVLPALRISEYEKVVEIPAEDLDDQSEYTLPDDYLEVREFSGRVVGETVTSTLGYQPPATFHQVSQHEYQQSGSRPVYTVLGRKVRFSDYLSPPFRLHYWTKIPALTEDNYADHAIAQADAAIYLHGVLSMAHQEFRNPTQEVMEFERFAERVDALNAQTRRMRSGSTPLKMVISGGVP